MVNGFFLLIAAAPGGNLPSLNYMKPEENIRHILAALVIFLKNTVNFS